MIHNDQDLLAMNLGEPKELGFDTETRPSFSKGEFYNVALLQLSTHTDAYLIRLQYVTRFHVLNSILENKEIVKVGVAIRDDLKLLQKTFNFTPQNFVELQDLAKVKGLKNFGLKGMTEEVLQASLSKRSKLTNWDASELSEQQQMYAATDAWIGLTIYRKLMEK
ncbi:MAG: 3'-5' exonuclease [Bdellovibrionales bacterium]